MAEFEGGVIFCPLCCSKIDLVREDMTVFECYNCGQRWGMTIDPDRLAQYSIA